MRKLRRDIIFFHLPKCGGTSIRFIAEQYSNFHVSLDGRDPMTGKNIPAEALVRGIWFTSVRNPWERAVSTMAMFSKKKYLAGAPRGRPRSLREIIELADIDWSNYSIPSAKGVRGCDAEIRLHMLPAFYLPLDKMDYIFRLETLEADWKRFTASVGLPNFLPKKNVSEHAHYATYFDDKLREKIESIYRPDIERFGYSFESGE